MADSGALLTTLERRMAQASLRGQWQVDANRPQRASHNAAGHLSVEPLPAGATHVWHWRDMQPILREACEAMPESNTARRALIMTNPALQRGTTHTLLASIQVVRPGEIAWAHRHVINALRFAIEGGDKVYTVVEGRELVMHPYDLLLTPGWTWHDHHNESSSVATWLDALDVPVTLALNQQFYEELGEASQKRMSADVGALLFRSRRGPRAADERPYRYPWADMARLLDRPGEIDPCHGWVVDYVDPSTGGSVLPTIHCRIEMLPPGFSGRCFRTTASEIAFVVEGEGVVETGADVLDWQRHDCVALPNWSERRMINKSKRDRAVLFVLNDAPLLEKLGFLRDERA